MRRHSSHAELARALCPQVIFIRHLPVGHGHACVNIFQESRRDCPRAAMGGFPPGCFWECIEALGVYHITLGELNLKES